MDTISNASSISSYQASDGMYFSTPALRDEYEAWLNGSSSGSSNQSGYQQSEVYSSMINAITDMRDYDNTWSAQQASLNRDFQSDQALIQRLYNSEEAQKNRDWQEMMSNTAHQREVNDLLSAGLNPILSAMGNGSAVTSGATASASAPSGSTANGNQSAGMAIANILSTILNNQTELEYQKNSAELQREITEKQLAMNEYLSMIGFDVQKYGYDASMHNANVAAAATQFAAQMNYDTQDLVSSRNLLNNKLQRDWQAEQNVYDRAHEARLKEEEHEFTHQEAMLHPKNAYDAAAIAGYTAAELLNALDVPVNNSTLSASRSYENSDHSTKDWILFMNSINY